jgi:lysophospholipase L1-like esterase/uncharacterized protein YjeT (DUF2065 family)
MTVAVAVLAILEGLARLAEPVAPQWQRPANAAVVMAPNATRLWGMTPGVHENIGTKATICANGLRAPCPESRPGGKERVLVVGDSTFFGHGVGDADTIPARLEEALHRRGIDADVVNGAVPGYSTEQTRILLDEVGWATDPTLLVVGNLWSDNTLDAFRDADLLRTVQDYADNPLAGSALFRLVAGAIGRLRGDAPHVINWTRSSAWPTTGIRRVPLQRYAANLDQMARDARGRGIGVAFVAPANKSMFDGDESEGSHSWDPYFDAQEAVAAWHGVPLAHARDALAADPLPSEAKFVDLMHPSPAGARDIADAIAAALTGAGWPGARLLAREQAYDPSGLVDGDPTIPMASGPRFSVQAQLFPIPDGDPAKTSEGDGPEWEARGTIQGGRPPYHIVVLDPLSRPARTLDVAAEGAFSMKLDVHIVELVLTDADGRTVRREVTAHSGAVALELR